MPHSRLPWLRHQRQRWLRHDAHLWIRPDAARFVKPGTDPADIYPTLARKAGRGKETRRSRRRSRRSRLPAARRAARRGGRAPGRAEAAARSWRQNTARASRACPPAIRAAGNGATETRAERGFGGLGLRMAMAARTAPAAGKPPAPVRTRRSHFRPTIAQAAWTIGTSCLLGLPMTEAIQNLSRMRIRKTPADNLQDANARRGGTPTGSRGIGRAAVSPRSGHRALRERADANPAIRSGVAATRTKSDLARQRRGRHRPCRSPRRGSRNASRPASHRHRRQPRPAARSIPKWRAAIATRVRWRRLDRCLSQHQQRARSVRSADVVLR